MWQHYFIDPYLVCFGFENSKNLNFGIFIMQALFNYMSPVEQDTIDCEF